MISVVVPVKVEPPPGPDFLSSLSGDPAVEVLVTADPATSRSTLEGYEKAGFRVLRGGSVRGQRLADASLLARGSILLFLHADTLLPDGWARRVTEAIESGAVGGAFRLGFSGGGWKMSWVATWANWRTRLTRVPYGDQSPFARKDVYLAVGGHPPWPLLEDVELGRRLKVKGPIAILPVCALTSPRRYLERGVARTVLKNWSTLLRFRFGASPERLAEEYRR